jgi:hypothetical protein
MLQGGDLDGCAVEVVEQLYGRDEGVLGPFVGVGGTAVLRRLQGVRS